MQSKKAIFTGIVSLGMLAIAACQTTSEALDERAKKHAPGSSAHNWVNGTWTGSDDRFDKTYWMRVVDGNKIIGREESCSRSGGGCSGAVPLWGEVISEKVLDVTYDKTAVPGVGRIFRQELTRAEKDTLWGPGFQLKKVKP